MSITALEVITALRLANGLAIAGKKIAITLGGEELTDEELVEKIDEAILQVELNRDTD